MTDVLQITRVTVSRIKTSKQLSHLNVKTTTTKVVVWCRATFTCCGDNLQRCVLEYSSLTTKLYLVRIHFSLTIFNSVMVSTSKGAPEDYALSIANNSFDVQFG